MKKKNRYFSTHRFAIGNYVHFYIITSNFELQNILAIFKNENINK